MLRLRGLVGRPRTIFIRVVTYCSTYAVAVVFIHIIVSRFIGVSYLRIGVRSYCTHHQQADTSYLVRFGEAKVSGYEGREGWKLGERERVLGFRRPKR